MDKKFLLLLSLFLTPTSGFSTEERNSDFFEKKIRPIFILKCQKCHGPKKQKGGLRVDSLNALLQGGERGPAIIQGQSQKSLLVQAVSRQSKLKMPPNDPLSPVEIQALKTWIDSGAVWPESQVASDFTQEIQKQHWAFQSLKKVSVPSLKDKWIKNPIDAFVLKKLHSKNLKPSPKADRRTLLRRLSYTLTGLPPSYEETERFKRSSHDRALEQAVDRLLQSQHYGEHWARHWLDVARYSDTKGYVYARENRTWVHAWVYRDWVTGAFNEDMPYDRFLLLQLAADQVDDRKPGDLAAMGYLTLGRRFLGVTPEIIDDRIDVVTRGMLGLTVSCARCHDHKYDPISTQDYYSLYGVFNSSKEEVVQLATEAPGDEAFVKGLKERKEKFEAKFSQYALQASERVRGRIKDYLLVQKKLHTLPKEGFDQILGSKDLYGSFAFQWRDYLKRAKEARDPLFIIWHAYFDLTEEDYKEKGLKLFKELQSKKDDYGSVFKWTLEHFKQSPTGFQGIVKSYAELLTTVDKRWKIELKKAKDQEKELPTRFENPSWEAVRKVLYSKDSPCEVPREPMANTERFFPTRLVEELWRLEGAIDNWIMSAGSKVKFSKTLKDRRIPREPRVFIRGNPRDWGPEVKRQYLTTLSKSQKPFTQGSGRFELAQKISSSENPLTVRVIVNRVWAKHFGRGLVSTPSDFGLRAQAPSHPELLDWLSRRFIEEGWSLKALHRLILTSSTYQQSSLIHSHSKKAFEQDPENRLLWRMNPKRLSFEEFRDSMLISTGQLDPALGGRPVNILNAPFSNRRTLYGTVDRQFFPSVLRTFDFANPDIHIPQRRETTVPQQALFFMNHPLVLNRVKKLSQSTQALKDSHARIRATFRSVFQRDPSPLEVREAEGFLRQDGVLIEEKFSPQAKDWHYGLGRVDPVVQKVVQYSPLPHFTGEAWQGGPQWPDRILGWVQLTATGGHPGNHLGHAAVRRWKAPRAMEISIRSELNHQSPPGDGIQAYIISSRSGFLNTVHIHQQIVGLHVSRLRVEKGETIDFVVDIKEVLNSDEHLWGMTIEELSRDSKSKGTIWNSVKDFTPLVKNQLTPWEQFAQMLLLTNEFLFVD